MLVDALPGEQLTSHECEWTASVLDSVGRTRLTVCSRISRTELVLSPQIRASSFCILVTAPPASAAKVVGECENVEVNTLWDDALTVAVGYLYFLNSINARMSSSLHHMFDTTLLP